MTCISSSVGSLWRGVLWSCIGSTACHPPVVFSSAQVGGHWDRTLFDVWRIGKRNKELYLCSVRLLLAASHVPVVLCGFHGRRRETFRQFLLSPYLPPRCVGNPRCQRDHPRLSEASATEDPSVRYSAREVNRLSNFQLLRCAVVYAPFAVSLMYGSSRSFADGILAPDLLVEPCE